MSFFISKTPEKAWRPNPARLFLCICFPARLLRSAVFFRFLRSICQFRRQKALNIRNSPAHLFDIVCRVHCLSLQAHYTFRQLSLDIRHRQRDFPHASQKQSVHSPKTNGFPSDSNSSVLLQQYHIPGWLPPLDPCVIWIWEKTLVYVWARHERRRDWLRNSSHLHRKKSRRFALKLSSKFTSCRIKI